MAIEKLIETMGNDFDNNFDDLKEITTQREYIQHCIQQNKKLHRRYLNPTNEEEKFKNMIETLIFNSLSKKLIQSDNPKKTFELLESQKTKYSREEKEKIRKKNTEASRELLTQIIKERNLLH